MALDTELPDSVEAVFPHYILAGGRSRRFGRDKARYLIDGKPMVTRVAEAFASHSCRTVVVAREAGAYEDLGLTTIADAATGMGPLAGLQAAFQPAHTQAKPTPAADQPASAPSWILLSSCDLIDPQAHMISPLIENLRPGKLASVYRRSDLYEPFPGLYCTAVLETVNQVLNSPKRSFQALFGQLAERVVTHPLPDSQGALDMNQLPMDRDDA